MDRLPDMDHWDYYEEGIYVQTREALSDAVHACLQHVMHGMHCCTERYFLEGFTPANISTVLAGIRHENEKSGDMALVVNAHVRTGDNTWTYPSVRQGRTINPQAAAWAFDTLNSNQRIAAVTYAYLHRRDALHAWYMHSLHGDCRQLEEITERRESLEEHYAHRIKTVVAGTFAKTNPNKNL